MISRSFFYPDSPPSEIEDSVPRTSDPPSTRHLDLLSLTAPVSSVVLQLDPYQDPLPLTSQNLASIAKRPSQRRRRLPALLARFSSSGPACDQPPSSDRSLSRASFHQSSLPSSAAGHAASLPRDRPADQEPPSDSPSSSHVARSQRDAHTPIPVPYSFTRKGSLAGRSLPADSSETFTSTSSRPFSSLRHLQSINEHDFARKMHQTSSRLLRMTDDERPYTRVCQLAFFYGC
jgi:hypothetical protein